MPELMTSEHLWEAITVQPVEVLIDADGDPVLFSDPDEPGVTLYGCRYCNEGIDIGIHTKCEPEAGDDADILDPS